ncbi:aminoglycoside phosphotransferase family protein [Streptomyces yangpuensis]|uniref:aminoglycoside phosphotransferase family protein n=1 Tax=Streptomyces yangpuensis TaxID=1648182 RepID=UPI00069C335E
MDILEVPRELVEAQVRYNGDAGREFVAALPARAAEFLERWRLRRVGPVMHGVTALVLPVQRADGSGAVLKLVSLDEECVGEPVALRAWDVEDGEERLDEEQLAVVDVLLGPPGVRG